MSKSNNTASRTATFWLSTSLALLVGGLAACLALIPTYLFQVNQGGVSNYGVAIRTVVPFTIAIGGSALCIFMAALQLPKDSVETRSFRRLLLAAGTTQLLVLVTTYPYKVSLSFDALHNLAAIVLFTVELISMVWMYIYRSSFGIGIAGGIFMLAFLLNVLTLVGISHSLFIAETGCAFSFATALILASKQHECR